MIKIESLMKSYGGFLAVDNLSFSVEEGEVLGLVGPNGAGKTTTMRCITGIIPPSSGSIHIGEFNMATHPVEAKRQMAFVPAEVRVFDHLTVREHLVFFSRMYCDSGIHQDPDKLLQDLNLAEKQHQLPGALSRGMKQKLMIGCALIHQPQVLIMDEPFTGLDPHAIRAMRHLLKAQAEKGTLVVISSHLLGMVEDFVTRLLVIQGGHKVAYGTKAELSATLPQLQADADLEEIFIEITGNHRGPTP